MIPETIDVGRVSVEFHDDGMVVLRHSAGDSVALEQMTDEDKAYLRSWALDAAMQESVISHPPVRNGESPWIGGF